MLNNLFHYDDVIITTLASQITSLMVVYSIVSSGVDQRKHQSSASLAFVRGIHQDRWIPRTKGQQRGKCFHLMTSSCSIDEWLSDGFWCTCVLLHFFLVRYRSRGIVPLSNIHLDISPGRGNQQFPSCITWLIVYFVCMSFYWYISLYATILFWLTIDTFLTIYHQT